MQGTAPVSGGWYRRMKFFDGSFFRSGQVNDGRIRLGNVFVFLIFQKWSMAVYTIILRSYPFEWILPTSAGRRTGEF